MTRNGRRAARPVSSRREATLALETQEFEEAVTRAIAALDRQFGDGPLHILACSIAGCVEPTVALFDEQDADAPLRLCDRHRRVMRAAISMMNANYRRRLEADEFAALEPALQYGLEGR